jgi:CPA2 family monovalent cation:H+ antiporter-2
VRAGTALIPRGEFAIVIAGIGVAAGQTEDLGSVTACYVLVLAVAGPIISRFADPIADAILRRRVVRTRPA